MISIGFRSQAAKGLKNQQFSIFSIDKPTLPNLTLPLNRSRSTYDHHLNKLLWAGVTDAIYQVVWKSVHQFRRGRFFAIYGHDGHLGYVTTIVSINFHFLVPESLHIKFSFDWPNGSLEKQVLIFKCK